MIQKHFLSRDRDVLLKSRKEKYILRFWMRLTLRVHTTCCHSLKVTHTSPAVTRSGRDCQICFGCEYRSAKCCQYSCRQNRMSLRQQPGQVCKTNDIWKTIGIHSLGPLLSNKKLFIQCKRMPKNDSIICMVLRNFPQNATNEQNSLTVYFLSVYFYLQYFFNAR